MAILCMIANSMNKLIRGFDGDIMHDSELYE